MKNIGIIGGLAPQSTTLFYAEIIRLCQLHEHVEYPNMLINSLKLMDVVSLLNDKASLLQLIKQEIGKIQEHVDFIAIPCNTIHFIIDEIREMASVPILAIHEEVCKNISLSHMTRVGILGTKTTVYNNFYQKELDTYGIAHEILDEENETELNAMIFNKMIHGKNYFEMQELIKKHIDILSQRGCDAIVLACTELPLFISQDAVPVKLFASTTILASSVVQMVFTE